MPWDVRLPGGGQAPFCKIACFLLCPIAKAVTSHRKGTNEGGVKRRQGEEGMVLGRGTPVGVLKLNRKIDFGFFQRRHTLVSL